MADHSTGIQSTQLVCLNAAQQPSCSKQPQNCHISSVATRQNTVHDDHAGTSSATIELAGALIRKYASDEDDTLKQQEWDAKGQRT